MPGSSRAVCIGEVNVLCRRVGGGLLSQAKLDAMGSVPPPPGDRRHLAHLYGAARQSLVLEQADARDEAARRPMQARTDLLSARMLADEYYNGIVDYGLTSCAGP